MQDTKLAEVFDVAKLEDEVSALVGARSAEAVRTPLRRTLPQLNKLDLEPGGQNYTEMAEPAGATDAQEDSVNHPKHYNAHPSGIECIEVTRWMNFNLGNVIKYLWRCDTKGATIEDLKKARWYLDDEIARLEKLAS